MARKGLAGLDFTRQLGLLSPEELNMPFTVIGAGGTGSPVLLMLPKMGCNNVTVFDPDSLESQNVPNSMHPPGHLGTSKVASIAKVVRYFTPVTITKKMKKYEGVEKLSGIVVSCVDGMDERAAIWSGLKMQSRVELYIDARMGGLVGKVFPVKVCDPDFIRFYEDTLHSDEDATQDECTAQAIIFNTLGIASVIGAVIRKHVRGEHLNPQYVIDLANLEMHTVELP